MITMTAPHRFFNISTPVEQLEIIRLIEVCFNSAPPPFEKINGEKVTSIGIVGTFSNESLTKVALRYVALGWSKVVTETSQDRGERPGIIYIKFYI